MHLQQHASASPIRVTFVVAGLACGGIERSVVTLMRGLTRRGYAVALVSFAAEDRDFFAPPAGVQRASLRLDRGRPLPLLRMPFAIRARLAQLREAIERTHPDVVIAHAPQINVPTLLAMRDHSCPVIVTEHGDVPIRPSLAKPWLWRKWAWYRLRRRYYPLARRVVSVSAAIDRNLSWLPQAQRTIIHNPFAPVDTSSDASLLHTGVLSDKKWADKKWIVTMGRLTRTKGHDILLEAFGSIARRFPEWQLLVIGDGELRGSLEQQAAPLGGQVVFTGAIREPFALLKRAELFVMASRYEGFPMAHGEALLCGLPVIATDCPSRPGASNGGVRELIRHGLNGWLVAPEDPVELAEAMVTCMSDSALRTRFAKAAPGGMAAFSAEVALDKWERLLRYVIPAKRSDLGAAAFTLSSPPRAEDRIVLCRRST